MLSNRNHGSLLSYIKVNPKEQVQVVVFKSDMIIEQSKEKEGNEKLKEGPILEGNKHNKGKLLL